MKTDPSDRWDLLGRYFSELETMPRTARATRLGEIAAQDPGLARDLAELLEEHDADRPLAIEALLDRAAHDVGDASVSRLGRTIGPYRLLEVLGRGGMGEVFLAERTDGQFEKRVALKLVRAALDDPEARARFLAERQILARLEHPNIARLLDGGVTDDGAPYLVMEWVQGEPITAYCDRLRLGIPERLELLIQACHAVHAAHRMLVVHRDLKPSNILVDHTGAVKLLDFGIAKLLEPDGSDAAPRTHTGSYLLTPEYASPEQVTGEPIGTTADVYSIGLVAYRLLTGRSGQPVATRSPVGIHRAVCLEAPRPASRAALDDADGDAESRAQLRGGSTAIRLARRLAGDVDTILEMALRKEPERRYLSAEDLAADLRRHLDRKPVTARGDTVGYRAARFVSRHRGMVLATSAAFLALAVGLAVAVSSLGAARRAEAHAVAEADSSRQLAEFAVGLFDASDPTFAPGQEVTARSLLDRGAATIRRDLHTRPDLLSDMLLAIGGAYDKLGYQDQAIGFLEEAADLRAIAHDPAGRSEALRALATAQLRAGRFEIAASTARRALEIAEGAEGVSTRDLADACSILGEVLFSIRRSEEAIPLVERAVALRRTLSRPEPRRLAIDLDVLGNSIFDRGDQAAGLALLREAVAVLERADAAPTAIADNLTRLGLRLVAAGHLDEARRELDRSLALARDGAAGGRHPEIQDALLARATLAETTGRLDDADDDLALALEESEAIWGEAHPKTAMVRLRRGQVLLAASRYDAAVAELRAGREALGRRSGGHHAHLAAFDLPIAQALAASGRIAEAREIARRLAAEPDSRYAEQARQLLESEAFTPPPASSG